METRSDLAQKLLHDLRLRKERMTSSREPMEFHTNAAIYRDAQQGTALQSGRKPNGGSKSFDISESSNQIILKNSQPFTDLPIAVSFAFENTKKLSKTSSPSNNPLLNFFTRLSRGPMTCKKLDIATLHDQNHITEISTGIEKLNQILKSCSNSSHNFDRNSIDLEESLRMLVNLQEAADYINGPLPKPRLRLLEENKDDQENIKNRLLVEPPKFSFDKRQPHKRSASCIPDFDSTRNVKVKNELGSPEKGRISNIIARLMGLEELPHKEEKMRMQKDCMNSEGKERKVLSKTKTIVKDLYPGIRAEKGVESSKMVNTERKQIQKDLKLLEVQKDAISGIKTESSTTNKQQKYSTAQDKVGGCRSLHDRQKKLTLKEKAQQDSITFLAGDITTHEKEKRNVNKGHNLKQKRKDKYAHRAQVPRKPEGSENMERAAQKGQNLMGKKHKDCQVESLILTKQKNDTTVVNQESSKKEDQNDCSSPRKQLNDTEKVIDNTSLMAHKRPMDVSSAIKNKEISKEVQKNENTRKIDVQMIRQSTENVNRLTRSLKQSADMLHDLKQQMQKKRKDEQSDRSGEIRIVKPDAIIEITKPQSEAEKTTMSSCTEKDGSQTENIQNKLAPQDNLQCYDVASNSEIVSNDVQKVEEPCSSIAEKEIKQPRTRGDNRKSCIISHNHPQEQLTEPEKELKEIVIKSHQFLNSAEALFKLNIPLTFLHTIDDHKNEVKDKKLILDCAFEVMKRKAKRIAYHPYKKTTLVSPKLRSLDDLIKLLSKDFETLMFHDDEDDIAGYLCNLLENDVFDKVPHVNCMWDFEWDNMMMMFCEKDDVVRDLEKHVLNVLLDEITVDFLV